MVNFRRNNWSILNGKNKGICPSGWHIPKYAELDALVTAVNGNGNALKSVGQGTGAGAGINTSGFSALMSGFRDYDGIFYYLGGYTDFWSSSEWYASGAHNMYMFNYGSHIDQYYDDKVDGLSIRCLKDN